MIATVARVGSVAHALHDHDWRRAVCLDHDGHCCPAGDAHDMSDVDALMHQATAATIAVELGSL